MKYPCLVPKKYCRTEVCVELRREEVDNDGDVKEPVVIIAKCNYQDRAKTVLTPEKRLVQLSGVALFPGDVAPELSSLNSGRILIHGEWRSIYQGRKARNPDSTVNYSELEVM